MVKKVKAKGKTIPTTINVEDGCKTVRNIRTKKSLDPTKYDLSHQQKSKCTHNKLILSSESV